MILLPEEIKQLDHIPTSEIETDLRITEKEINDFEKELTVLRCNPSGNRLEIYMREGKIAKRKYFIIKLNQILDFRK